MTKKILIISSDNRNIKSDTFNNLKYHELSFFINSYYCQKNNYDFKYFKINDINTKKTLLNSETVSSYNTVSKLTKSASWTKLIIIYEQFLKKYKYIIYLDSDCFFYNLNEKIDSYINEIEKKQKIGLFFNDEPWNKSLPNCGFMIFRNCEWNKKLIRNWWNLFTLYNHNHPYEQRVFHKIWLDNKEKIRDKYILKKISLQKISAQNTLALHVTSNYRKKRILIMRRFVKKNLCFNKIDYNKYLKKNRKYFDPSKGENKINRKISLLDKVIIELHNIITLNFIFFVKKLRNIKLH